MTRGAGKAGRVVLGALAAALLAGCGAVSADPTSSDPALSDPVAAGASGAPTAGVGVRPADPVPSPEPTGIGAVPLAVQTKSPVRKPSAEPTAAPAHVLGASPLPLRPDGFGKVLPTPELLRDRRLPTVDLLPPPVGDAFASSVGAVTTPIRERMGESWSPTCPVALDDLRYLTVSFRGFDGQAHTGELVVAASVAGDVVQVFRSLYKAGFPIEEMRLPTTADLRAAPTGDGNNTAAYVCRAARGQTKWSQHAYGTAVDINPFHNPLVKRDLVIPELASAYASRSAVRPGMHVAGGPAVRAFEAIGWSWGGKWRSSKDWMHFSLTGG